MKKLTLPNSTKKCAFFLCALFITFAVFCQDAEKKSSELDRQKETLQFGLESEIIALLDGYIKNHDAHFANDVFDIFQKTQSSAMKEKIFQYFTALKDKRLSDAAIAILTDPYDSRTNLVSAVFRYVTELTIKEALPAITAIIKADSEQFFSGAITALGKLGGPEEALLLSEYVQQDYPLAQKQAIVRALGQLQAVETWSTLAAIAENPDENAYMRAYAAEAIGNMKKTESIPILLKIFDDTDPVVRAAVITGLANFNDAQAINAILEGFKDNQYRVRIEAAAAAEKLQLKAAVPVLVYRAKNDPEGSVRFKCFEVLSVLGGKEAMDFLTSMVENPKANDASRIKAASVLLKNQFNSGVQSVISAAEETLKDDKNKKLRYELGKEFAKYDKGALAGICIKYLENADLLTQGTGLDIFARNFFPTASALVKQIADNEKAGANQRKAKAILERGKL